MNPSIVHKIINKIQKLDAFFAQVQRKLAVKGVHHQAPIALNSTYLTQQSARFFSIDRPILTARQTVALPR